MRLVQTEALPRGRFDALTILFHWTTFVLILVQAATGLSLESVAGTPLGEEIVLLHRSTGVVVWVVVFLRLAWRSSFARLPPFPHGMLKVQRFAVTVSEYALYALLLVQPITGLTGSLLRARSVQIFVWTVPTLLPHVPRLADLVFVVHTAGAWILFSLVGGHALAALAHHYVARDDVLKTMAPWVHRLPLRGSTSRLGGSA